MTLRLGAFALPLALLAPAQNASPPASAAGLATELRQLSIDPQSCVRIRDLEFNREDVRFFFGDGYLLLAKPIAGRIPAAVYVARDSGDSAEILVRPPNRSERASLASFTQSPNLNERFRTGVFVFTDESGDRLREAISQSSPKPSPEVGILLVSQLDSVVRNLCTSFTLRMVEDLLTPAGQTPGFFFAALQSENHGNFDVLYDTVSREAVVLGQMSDRNGRPVFDVWTSFESRAQRQNAVKFSDPVKSESYVIEATLKPDLELEVTTRLTLRAIREVPRSLSFEIAPEMTVDTATLDGAPLEIFRRESLRESLIRGAMNEPFLVVLPRTLRAGEVATIEFKHHGRVVRVAGEKVFYVTARTNWYPNRGLQFARFDLTFRAPADLDLIATGELVEEKTEGEWKISRRRTSGAVRLAGFNLGAYRKHSGRRGAFSVDVYSNRLIEEALTPRAATVLVLPPARPGIRRNEVLALPPPPPPDPAARAAALASEVSEAFSWMASVLGPPPQNALAVSPIPGHFGQGFPGLLYLSTLAYLREDERPVFARSGTLGLFYSELLHAHEVAHQWWGNLVATTSYHDEWINEALANYTGLMVLEKKKGPKVLDSLLDEYARLLLKPAENGKPLDATGPITWGLRLQSEPLAWRAITYDKGSWILHMLRKRMGEAAFVKFLGALGQRFRYQAINTHDLQKTAAGFLPKTDPDPTLDLFFEQWVDSTGIPTLELRHAWKAGKLTLTLTQRGVSEEFGVDVPIEIRTGPQQPVTTKWLRSSNEPAVVTIPWPRAPQRVEIAPHAVLREP